MAVIPWSNITYSGTARTTSPDFYWTSGVEPTLEDIGTTPLVKKTEIIYHQKLKVNSKK